MRAARVSILRTALGRVLSFGAAAAIAVLPHLAQASEKAHHGEAHGIPWNTLLFSTINFAIFSWIIYKFVYPVIRDHAQDRQARIVAELRAAATARAEAEALKAQWEQRLAALQTELKEIRASAEADLAREREQILAAARKTAEAIGNDARRVADQEIRRAEADLRETVVREAIAAATALAQQRLSPADQDRFIGDFLTEVRS